MAASPPSPVLGAFVFRNWARPVALPNTSSALGGGRAPAQDTLCAVAAGRLPTAAGQPTPGGGGAKSTGKASVSSFMVSTLSMCVPRMHACVPRMRACAGNRQGVCVLLRGKYILALGVCTSSAYFTQMHKQRWCPQLDARENDSVCLLPIAGDWVRDALCGW